MTAKPVMAAAFRLAARLADDVRKAILGSIDAREIAQQFFASHADHSPITSQAGRAWAKINVKIDSRALLPVLTEIYNTGGLIGNDAANQDAKRALMARKDASISSYWDNWKPGDHPAELLVRPKGGLLRLQNGKAQTIQGMDETTQDRIGVMLADALKTGKNEDWVVEQILGEGIAGSSRRALTIAHTEMNRAVNAQKVQQFQDLGFTKQRWVVTDPCDVCVQNEDEVVTIGDEFPSGDTEPPVHTNCNCTVVPDTSEYDPTPEQLAMLDKAASVVVMSITKAGVPGPTEVERAHNRLAILPNPADPALPDDELAKLVESPWAMRAVPTIDPNVWDNAVLETIEIGTLLGTDPYLKRKKVAKHIDAMGQAITPFRSYPLVYETDNEPLIIDGHHRLMAMWLLGLDKAPVWIVKA